MSKKVPFEQECAKLFLDRLQNKSVDSVLNELFTGLTGGKKSTDLEMIAVITPVSNIL